MMVNDNPVFSKSELSLLENKVKTGQVEVKDLEELSAYLSGLGLSDFLLNSLKSYDVNSIEEFVLIAKNSKNNNEQDSLKLGRATGAILGILSALKGVI